MLEKIGGIFGKTDDVFRDYGMVLLMAFLAAISLMCFAEFNFSTSGHYFVFVKFSLVCMLGISLMFAVNMISQRIGKKILLEISGVIFLILYYFLLPDQEKDFTEKYAFLLIPTFILSHLLVSFGAFLGQIREINFWQYNKNLFINIFLTAVFTGVLTGGVELAILAVDKLFDFNFNGKYYTQTFYLLSIFGSCFIFLLFNERGLVYLEREDNYPVVLKFFTQYTLIPLLLIYAVILYFYSAKILMNWELPRGWVSYLILAYSVVGILALLLVHPLKQAHTKSWVKVFAKIFYYTLAPLLILLFVAIFTRILEYGYTEPRYYVLIIALWLTSVVGYFIFWKNTTIKFVPISLFIFGLFSLTMPYLNAFSVANRSQKSALQEILQTNNLLEKGKINFNQKVADSVVEEVSDKLNFLINRNQQSELMKLLTQNDQKYFRNKLANDSRWEFRNEVRNRFTQVTKTHHKSREQRLELIAVSKVFSIQDFQQVVPINNTDGEGNFFVGKDRFSIQIHPNNLEVLKIKINEGEVWDVTPALRDLFAEQKNNTGRVEVSKIVVEKDLANYHLKIVFGNLVRENYLKEQIYFNNALLLLQHKQK